MNLLDYGPVLAGPVYVEPSAAENLADRPLPFNIFDVDAVSRDIFRPYVKVLAPIDLSLIILNKKVFHRIAITTNLFASGRGRGDPMLSDWRSTDWKEIFRFFFANHIILAIRRCKATISEQQLFKNPLLGRLFDPRRFHQLTLAWRLKRDGQTPDEFLEHAPMALCAGFRQLLATNPPVMSLHTYQMPLWCGRAGEIMDAECRITVLQAGRYTLRAIFHKKAGDSEQSGNSPSISVPLLKKLLKGIPLEGRYFMAIGGATVEMAKFFHVSSVHMSTHS